MKKGGWSKRGGGQKGALAKIIMLNFLAKYFGDNQNGKLGALTQMGNSGLDGAISPTGVAFLELQWKGKGRSAPTLPKTPPPTLSSPARSSNNAAAALRLSETSGSSLFLPRR